MRDASYDVVIANHVLEHIDDDAKAMREVARLLRSGGIALLTTPINPTRHVTYEESAITAPIERQTHLNSPDLQRFYRLDIAERLRRTECSIETFRLTPPEEVTFGLLPMEWLHIATREMPPIRPIMFCRQKILRRQNNKHRTTKACPNGN